MHINTLQHQIHERENLVKNYQVLEQFKPFFRTEIAKSCDYQMRHLCGLT